MGKPCHGLFIGTNGSTSLRRNPPGSAASPFAQSPRGHYRPVRLFVFAAFLVAAARAVFFEGAFLLAERFFGDFARRSSGDACLGS